MNPSPQGSSHILRSRRIEAQTGEEYSILAVTTRVTGLFARCVTHDITIGRADYSKHLVIHAQGAAPMVGAPVKRKRIGGNGVTGFWADEAGRVIGGGFTTAAVPADWRESSATVGNEEVK